MNEPIWLIKNKPDERKSYLKSVFFMSISVVLFTCMIASIRVVSKEVDSFIIVFFRNFFGIIIIAPILTSHGIKLLKTKKLNLYLLRAFFGLLAMFTWFHGITVVPLAEAVALNFTMPLFITLIATLFLAEKVGWRRWTATTVGFLGAMIVLQPGITTIRIGHIELLAASFFMALSVITIKKLSDTEPPARIVAYMLIVFAPISLVPALFVWSWPSTNALLWLALVAISGTLAHLSFTRSLSMAEITAIMPLDFTRLPLTAIVAYLAFSETPSLSTWIGGIIIFLSTVYITNREAKNN